MLDQMDIISIFHLVRLFVALATLLGAREGWFLPRSLGLCRFVLELLRWLYFYRPCAVSWKARLAATESLLVVEMFFEKATDAASATEYSFWTVRLGR